MISAGMLNKKVTIQKKVIGTPGQDAYGQPSNTWATYFIVWASIEPIQGREFWAQQQIQSEVTVRVRTRYIPGVTTGMRIYYNSKIYSIESIIDVKDRHSEMQLMCSEGVKDE
jgi:SPP1 family predicted phage head-tail adaptor